MTEAYVLAWARAFALTLLIEACVALPLLGHRASTSPSAQRSQASAQASRARRLLAIAVGNLASHPLVWFVIPVFARGTLALALQEALAIAIEAAVYVLAFPALGLRSALGISAVANALSLGVGVLVREFTGLV